MRRATGTPVSGFLDTATPAQLLRAVASNHRTWFARIARVAGGEMRHDTGVVWIHTPGPNGEVTIPFPRLDVRKAGEQLDAAVRRCHGLDRLRHVSCWSLRERTSPPDLGVRLAARGFEWGWRPHWMALDLQQVGENPPLPSGLRVALVPHEAVWDVQDLPYYDRETARRLHALAQVRPRRVWHFAAWMGERPVGQSVLHLTTGRLGVAGIFNVGVVPDSRGRGVATAVMNAALRFARELGCRYALLNSTEMGEVLYRSLGFATLGYGQTWWLHQNVLDREPPTQLEVAFAEAVGRGDIATLDTLAHRLPVEVLDAALPCGLTPVQFAVKTGHPESVAWLVRHGATLDVVSAWDLGWKERVAELLAAFPDLANRRSGRQRITPLHAAVLRDDTELARVVLAAHPDLNIADTEFRSTALGWARHFGREEIIWLIEREQGGVKPNH